jgi:hypothetical protein
MRVCEGDKSGTREEGTVTRAMDIRGSYLRFGEQCGCYLRCIYMV